VVYFYQSPSGGKVFFDELGPPWPKHPCTDNPLPHSVRTRSLSYSVRNAAADPSWRKEGWVPIRVEVVRRRGEWGEITGRRLDNHKSFVRLVRWWEALIPGVPALVKPLNARGLGLIEWIATTPRGLKVAKDTLAHQAYQKCSNRVIKAALAGDGACATKVGRAVSFDWAKGADGPQDAEYPVFLDWSIAEEWFRLAAQLGDSEAIDLLKRIPSTGQR
jgi:hypothetical protein